MIDGEFVNGHITRGLLTWLLMGEVSPVVLEDRYDKLIVAEGCAAFTSIVTITQNSDGKSNPSRFENTRMFVNENGRWGCA